MSAPFFISSVAGNLPQGARGKKFSRSIPFPRFYRQPLLSKAVDKRRITCILVGMLKSRNSEQTKKTLVDSARREIHRKGFVNASLNNILSGTGLTRGALYHHFPNKMALGRATLERIREEILDDWIRPLDGYDDPITGLREVMVSVGMSLTEEDIRLGCPLNNLAQEMAPADEEFRKLIDEMYETWRAGVADALRRGQSAGTVTAEVDADGVAAFFVSALTGARGLAKTAQNAKILGMCAANLVRYLETLRAR